MQSPFTKTLKIEQPERRSLSGSAPSQSKPETNATDELTSPFSAAVQIGSAFSKRTCPKDAETGEIASKTVDKSSRCFI